MQKGIAVLGDYVSQHHQGAVCHAPTDEKALAHLVTTGFDEDLLLTRGPGIGGKKEHDYECRQAEEPKASDHDLIPATRYCRGNEAEQNDPKPVPPADPAGLHTRQQLERIARPGARPCPGPMRP